MTNGTVDPAQQWAGLLTPLSGRRREAVVAALRGSAHQGWPADAEAVRLLVAYAQGEIDAQDYAVGIVVSLGGSGDLVTASSPPAAVASSAPATAAHYDERGPGPTLSAAPVYAPPVTTTPPAAAVSKDEAVAAYVAGRISVEEFLRITRGVA